MNYKNRQGPWMELQSGKRFYPLDFRPEDVDINDIASGLARESRFNGQFRLDVPFYSVAQHSVIGSRLCPDKYARLFLAHDATEAYSKDLPKPLKILLPEYEKMEKEWFKTIAIHFNLPRILTPEFKVYDTKMLFTERRDVMNKSSNLWEDEVEPFDFKIKDFWLPQKAREEFLKRFYELF